MGGDATDDANQVSEGSEIFIAIGTEAGKVLVFNILGLLIHEVTMSMRVINLGWVVNRSVCSTLSNRNSCSVRDESLKHPEASCTEDTDTVKRATSPCKQVGIQKLFPLASTGDLFSNEPSRHITTMPAGTLSDISLLRPKHSPTPVKRKSLVRPRIVKETFKSPIASSSPLFMSARAVLPSELPAPRLQETRKWTEAQNAPCAAVESCVGRISADKAALSSSQESETASQDFFTPPSTRRRKGKIPQYLPTPDVTDLATMEIQERQYRPLEQVDPIFPDGKSTCPPLSVSASKIPRREVVIDGVESLSQNSSPGSRYSNLISRVTRDSFLGHQRNEGWIQRLLGATTKDSQCTATDAVAMSLTQDTPSSGYSQPTSHAFRDAPGGIDGEVSTPGSGTQSAYRNLVVGGTRRIASVEFGRYDPEHIAEKRSHVGRRGKAGTSVDEVRRLRGEIQALWKDMEALREEFRIVKSVLLHSKARL